MDLLSFIADPERKRKLAAQTNTSEGYLWQIATSWRGKRASPELALAIERESEAIGPEPVGKQSIRPDIWQPGDSPTSRRSTAAPEGGAAAEATDDQVSPVSEAA